MKALFTPANVLGLGCLLTTVLGCSEASSVTPEASATGGASTAGASSAGAWSAGAPSAGGSSPQGGSSPRGGAGASPNDVAGSAGIPPAADGGTAGTAVGTAGSGNQSGDASIGGGESIAGSAGAGGSQAGGSAADDQAAAQVLDGYSISKPCVSSFKPTHTHPNGDCCCEEEPANENQHVRKQFGGDPKVIYDVKVRIAGIAERYWYESGTLDQSNNLFYIGGLPTIHSAAASNKNLQPGKGACKVHPPETDGSFKIPFAVPSEINPADGCFNGFNIFALTVSEPKQTYYLNYTSEFDGADRQPHKVYTNDYTVTLTIKGQAQLDFYTIDGDHHQVTNDGSLSVPNVKTAQPYNGNFLEFTVLAVTRAK